MLALQVKTMARRMARWHVYWHVKMRTLHAFGTLARKPRWHTSSWHVNYSFKLSLKLKVKTVKFNKKKEIKSHNSVYFSSY